MATRSAQRLAAFCRLLPPNRGRCPNVASVVCILVATVSKTVIALEIYVRCHYERRAASQNVQNVFECSLYSTTVVFSGRRAVIFYRKWRAAVLRNIITSTVCVQLEYLCPRTTGATVRRKRAIRMDERSLLNCSRTVRTVSCRLRTVSGHFLLQILLSGYEHTKHKT